ncbi:MULTISPECIES: oxygen-dependent tRNA uridine(34) hydroxylase TrhO [Aurantimonas]|uniref:oxygen-dependent tRNA uridine(34) hydroxylase TrhO n=1 Tax=Aurantimonas TaxID=182269 RepID=UPI0003FA4235|nr:rhodanese-related sulfurtransferase [Aurantimonas coralicida]
MPLTVATFYRFVTLDDLPALKAELAALCADTGTRGTILIAPEGINGTLAGPRDGVATMVAHLDRRCGIGRGELKFSAAEDWPFARTKVRIRPEIITMRAPEADPSRRVGTYVAPSDWNALIDDPEVLVLDTRNRYETKVGGFAGAVDPAIDSFTDFKAYVETALDPAEHRKVAMFCTGGIRCEKASAYMLSKGFESVFHLKGGILQYLEDVPQEDSRWEGDCYVFDGRVAVGHGLARTDWTACYGCGQPLSPEERADPAFEEGVSCAHCIDRLTEEKAASLRERQRQIMREAGRD